MTDDSSVATLPRGWAIATVEDIARYVNGVAFKPADWNESGRPIIRIQNLTGQSEHYNRTNRPVQGDAVVTAGSILVSWSATLDVFVWRGADAVLNQHIFKVIPNPAIGDARFVRWVLKHAIEEMSVGSHVHGTTMRHINRAPFLAHPVPLPPNNEQERIADAIESASSRLDEAIGSLERAQFKLKAYRSSVLNAAVQGRLVPTEAELARAQNCDYEPADILLTCILVERRRRWEEAELAKLRAAGKSPEDERWKSKYVEAVEPASGGLAKLPEGWCWASLDQLAYHLRNGQSKAPRENTGIRILRISAVRPLSINLSDVRFLPGDESDYFDDLIAPDDLLFTRYNGNVALVGACARVPNVSEPTVHPDKLIRVRLNEGAEPAYIEIAANAGASRDFIQSRCRTTAGQTGISGRDLRHMPVAIPPRAEQQRIAETVAAMLSVSDAGRRDIDRELRRIQRLRRSILKHAFEGTLVNQDPTDEPASILLERIHAERPSGATVTKLQFRRKAKKAQ